MQNITTTYSAVDRLYYVRKNDEVIATIRNKPTESDLIEIEWSDNWQSVFLSIKKGNKTRVSSRIFSEMLGAVPPIQFNGESFYCGECYSGNLYYYFSTDKDGKHYGELKPITPPQPANELFSITI